MNVISEPAIRQAMLALLVRYAVANRCGHRTIFQAWAGEPPTRQPGREGAGSIPAWAGEPNRAEAATMSMTVYPRVDGSPWANVSGNRKRRV